MSDLENGASKEKRGRLVWVVLGEMEVVGDEILG